MKIKTPSRDDASVDMAPMIDLVFLLLIFFMVASVVTELDKVEVAIPSSDHAKVPDDTKGRMMLSVDANGQVYSGTLPVTLEELKVLINSELDLNPDLRILIRADKLVEYKTCKELMIACGEVGATDLIYATFEE
ncbi:ExbD/TolR family protein [Pontiella sulfatireligans]|uniref:Biopolymer transport protein ExbD n=1 Tax=Pontiella sulfatireligans TaxID=2750658 RepID=A0A6C2UG71_9BACT|nr:biopolymer transporter ExbD [Pontiella sulfatireligans]VGO19165.1 Biopolymer transport protein ExbD [Pontiella sulfatireligans]